jgi:hypothetical protein
MVAQTIAIQQQALGRGSVDLPLDPVYIVIEQHTLTIAEIIRRGMIALSQRHHDVDAAPTDQLRLVLRAHDAFERQGLCVLVNGRQVETLDELVICSPQTAVTFLRLESLA